MTLYYFVFLTFVVFGDGTQAQRGVIEAFYDYFILGMTGLIRFLLSLTSVT